MLCVRDIISSFYRIPQSVISRWLRQFRCFDWHFDISDWNPQTVMDSSDPWIAFIPFWVALWFSWVFLAPSVISIPATSPLMSLMSTSDGKAGLRWQFEKKSGRDFLQPSFTRKTSAVYMLHETVYFGQALKKSRTEAFLIVMPFPWATVARNGQA